MTVRLPGRWLAAAAGMLLVVAAVAAGFVLRDSSSRFPPRPPDQRPELRLLTSLPIVFPEGFTLNSPASPALEALRSRYSIAPISVADRDSLRGGELLLMAQPRAQPAEALVELDEWVRGGGRVLLLADPALAWPSELPLGDALRPPLAYPDTGLLGHWGLRLDSPERPGPTRVTAGGEIIRTISPGSLVATGPACTVGESGLVARCWIASGSATVIADADFLESGKAESGNLDLLLAELARLEP